MFDNFIFDITSVEKDVYGGYSRNILIQFPFICVECVIITFTIGWLPRLNK